jgi:hypothetical protein
MPDTEHGSSVHVISKTLSANDTSETGAHQAGILIPKRPEILSFFPPLDATEKNPRLLLRFTDAAGETWDFAFIYYNNRRFGGTRNEYRLTHMTQFLRHYGLKTGDTVIFKRTRDKTRYIEYARRAASAAEGRLRIGSGWKLISI